MGLLVSTICHMIPLGSDSKVLSLAWNPNTHTHMHTERAREREKEYAIMIIRNNCI